MRIRPHRLAAPAEPLLTLADIKPHLVVSENDDDQVLEAMVAAVEAYIDGCDGILGRALVAQTWVERFPAFEACMSLALAPLISIESVTYVDPDGASQTLSSAVYDAHEFTSGPGLVLAPGRSWPATQSRPDAVAITYRAGYGAAAEVPEAIRNAAKMIVGSLYENREDHAPIALHTLPIGARAFLFPYMRKAF